MKGIVALLLAAALPALGQGYPSRTVTIVVPFPPGGGTDTGARLLATRLAQRWGQPVLVENKPGAAGMVGVEYVSKVKPDGYTLIMGNFGTQSVNPTLYAKKLAYNPDTAFTAAEVSVRAARAAPCSRRGRAGGSHTGTEGRRGEVGGGDRQAALCDHRGRSAFQPDG